MGLSPEELEARRAELEAKRRRKQEEQRRRMLWTGLLIGLGLLLAAISAYITYQRGADSVAADTTGPEIPERINVLVLGTDGQEFIGGRTDTMMLVSFHREDGQLGIISIPRDTRVQVPGRVGYTRVNAAHALGGPRLARETVEAFLGVPVHYHIKLDFEGFESVIDLLGGVEMTVEIPMRYDDYAQGLHINLEPGRQVLDGEQALHYVRYRGGLGDVSLIDPAQEVYAGRVNRQLEFVQALLQQALQPKTVLRLPQIVREVNGLIETDMPLDQMLSLSLTAREVGLEELEVAVLPGVGETIGGASYWVPDTARLQQVVDRVVHGRESS